jgi:AGCS family alanine or glycine:cation symporter
MIDAIERLNAVVNGYVWGWPMILLLMGTGLLLTVLTGFVQFRRLGFALREVLGRITQRGGGVGSVRPFQAVATALASTVGVGSIAGVATAISIGGPGSVFWLWLVFVYLGATGSLHLVWDIADTLNGLMAVPNLVGVLFSIPLLLKLQREFSSRRGPR